MDRRVETFLQVAENGSFSETARKLFISQPAVTQQIASLGDELGVRLFERDGNRMMLTTQDAWLKNTISACSTKSRLSNASLRHGRPAGASP